MFSIKHSFNAAAYSDINFSIDWLILFAFAVKKKTAKSVLRWNRPL